MGKKAEELSGFPNVGSYLRSVTQTPFMVLDRPWRRKTAAEQGADVQESAHSMKRCMGLLDLICLGVGIMLGAGVFVTTGYVAKDIAGPGVILSFVVAGVSALLSSVCYAEFSANLPLAGGAYCYISAVFGEYLAYITVANLIFEYILANAAVMRGFTPYFAMLINTPKDIFYTPYGANHLDWLAFGICLLLTILLTAGTKESAWFNLFMNTVHIALILFIIIAGFVGTKGSTANASPFLPYGIQGVFNGAAIVFFSYIGFDAVANSAEEVRNPSRNLPLGILGSLAIVSICYVLMATVLVLMVPYDKLDSGAPFAAAFETVGMTWGRYIVALGALFGIVPSTLVGMYATARIIAAVARQHLLPPLFAKVHARTATPWIATIAQGLAVALIALFTDFAELADMVSISTLFAFWIVALAIIWNRCYVRGVTPAAGTAKTVAGMLGVIASCLSFSIVYKLEPRAYWVGLVVSGAALFAFIVLLLLQKQHCRPLGYGVWLFPLTPCLSVFVNTFLMAQLNPLAYIRFAIWSAVITCAYVLYSMHAAAVKERRVADVLPGSKNSTTLGVAGGVHTVVAAGLPSEDGSARGGFVVQA